MTDDKNSKLLIYLIGPLSNGGTAHEATIYRNTHSALKTGNELMGCGVFVFIPHLSTYFDGRYPKNYEYWMEFDLRILSHCDAAFRMPGKSAGGDREEAFCMERGIPVFRDIEKLKEWAKP